MARTTTRALAALATSAVLAGGLAVQADAAPARTAPAGGVQARQADRPAPAKDARAQQRTADRTRQAAPQRTSAVKTTKTTKPSSARTTTAKRTAARGVARTTSTTTKTARTTATTAAATTATTTTAVTYASTTSISTAGLSSDAVKVLKSINANFPQVTSISGLRSGSDAQDHGTGHALDLMVPNYSSAQGKALGDEIAAYLQQHASELNVKYVIWRQHIWSVQRSSEGWRAMGDRGGVTANHYDHVHVSVN